MLPLLLVLTNLTGCTAHMPEGRRAYRADDPLAAATHFRRALDAQPDHAGAARWLLRAGPEALELRAQAVEAQTGAGRFEDALAEVERLRPLHDALVAVGAEPAWDPEDLAEGVRASAEVELTRAAQEAARTGRPGVALGHLERAARLRPESEGLVEAQRTIWIDWADAAEDPRVAAARLTRAAGLGSEQARGRAAELWTGLAAEARSQGACRRAVADLEAARALTPTAEIRRELASATGCAETWLSLEVDERAIRSTCPNADLLGRLERQLESEGSAFLRVAGPGDQPAPRTVPGPTGPEERGPAQITLSATRCFLRPGVASSQPRSRRVETPDGTLVLGWQEHRQPMIVELEARIEVAEGGEPLLRRSIQARSSIEAVWGSQVTSVTAGSPPYPSSSIPAGLDAGPEFDPKARPEDRRRRAAELARELALSQLSAQAAELTRATLDAE
jgi:tetratricopeptide (TPR) repeat protein